MQAEKKIFKARKQHAGAHIYIIGYLIHNQTYINYLSGQSVVTVSDTADIPDNSVVGIRTHGIRRQIEAELREKYQVLDLTCPKVKKIQLIIREHAGNGYFVLITGKRDHPEVQGLVSYAGNSDVIEKADDIVRFTETLAGAGIAKLFIVSQTTGEPELFHETVRRVREKAGPLGIDLEFYDSICSITAMREREALRLQREVDVTFVIGDRISSNATKLYKVLAADTGAAVFFVNSREELESLSSDFSLWKTALVVSSSSTPAFLEQEIAGYLEGL
jgi:4-hydroxy-3-methylbut-2-enyl diphosphate reductase